MMIESGTSQCPRLYNVILAGPQHREFRKEILQAMEVGDGAPNIEADQKSAFNNVQVGDGAPTQRIS
ncbi:Nitrogen regulation protein NIFR3 [Staphylococcus aureus]|nr:hypothetical protein MQO_02011 [Staphylococcus aureus subsp. aureus VRS8]EIK31860.1 hypothetical protein MQU_01160 [Staphylococcus aureus subsp. aureus VRS11a]EIK33420.1 hypothetical protein MQW_01440 [Staphylococcus aureus subsp. aureus VRS11b]EMZ04116.1 hypothetical protein I892_01030 [Staphylococcus aureus M1078]ENJ12544.1 hypothetical protein B954_00508 [Staphylococcus aureus M0210]ENL07232.1 hypothetical protein U35_01537 [Staphylococcus aureus M0676]ENL46325.1 hypothetical protein B4